MEPTAPDYRLEYMNFIKEAFQTMQDQSSLPGEFVLLNKQYPRIIILPHPHPEKQREHEIMSSGWQHDQLMRNKYSSTIAMQMLFQTDESGFIPDVVVLQGAAGIGKTMTARRIMLDWACGELYQDLFDYAFYIHCRGMNPGTEEKSMVDIILAQGAKKRTIKGMLRNPQKLLFVIDGFDELRFSIDQPEDCLCSDPRKKASLSVLLSSLFRKRLLPKSCLVITTRPTALEKLSSLLGRSRYAEILGFSPKDRREYFHRFFQNKDQAEKAFQIVRQNATLFSMCLVPIVCWIICTVMKQQLDRGEDLVQTSNTVTAVYMLYLSSLFKPSKTHGKRLVQTNLRGLCSLAADGIWKQEILFGEEEIQKYGLDQEDSLPLFLNENIFKRDTECICAYSFIHLSIQEFFAALSYVLEEESEALNPEKPNGDVKAVLDSYRTSRPDLALTVRFLFGLLNEEQRMRDLKEQFGWKTSPRIKEPLLQWMKNITGTKIACCFKSTPELFGLLYEIQDVDFVKCSLDHVMEVKLETSCFTELDIMRLSFCLRNCHNLEVMNLEYEVFYRKYLRRMLFQEAARSDHQEEEGELLGQLQLHQEREPVQQFCEAVMHRCSKLREIWLSGFNLTAGCCKELSHVLISNHTLVNLDVSSKALGNSGTKRLCEALRNPACKLQSLSLKHCNITAASCGDLASVLCSNKNLRDLQLGCNELGDSGLKFLCKGLKHPNCKLKSRGFSECHLTAACCEDLASVLCSKQSQGELDLSGNELGDGGLKLLCGALKHPNCRLQKLSTNQTLTDLDLEWNRLGDLWLRILCEGLKHPNCRLQKLGLKDCFITTASCWHFSSVLSTSQHLRELQLGSNTLGESGLTFLCKGLKDTNCKLQSIGFSECLLTADCCEDLSSVLCSNQSLRELDLSCNRLQKRGMKLLCGALEHPNCRLQKLR
ncbi:hypothetical protein lerEdw1_005233 [Lerista edwardsae]|nr:hypothetical protein lerEdw1_005233 [Lerista edwardsae]